MDSAVNGALEGQVFNIQRFSTHDGPGVRTTVFLKGCSLRCLWCQNPESQSIKPVLMFRKDLCTACGRCIPVCPNQANSLVDGQLIVDRKRCKACGVCTKPGVCLVGARRIEGKTMTVDEVMAQVVKDYSIYQTSGGGLTLSGGECMVQPEFSAELLKAAHENFINTCVEITGAFPWKTVKKITDHTDYILYDLKCMDEEKHKKGTGVSNKYVLENAKKIVKEGKNIRFRTPLVPGYNDDPKNIEATARFIRDELGLNPAEYLELLPYNNLGEAKYSRMGKDDFCCPHQRQTEEYLQKLHDIIAAV